MNARFYAPDAASPDEVIALPKEEAEHLTRVLRLAAGDAIRVFNGRGSEFDARIEEASKGAVRVRVGARRAAAPEARIAVTLAHAVLKGDKMDDVVRDAVMMGVAAIQPIITTRTEVTRAALDRSRRIDRWQRIAVSSAKQCRRAVVPPVLPPLGFEELLQAAASMHLPNPVVMLVEPGTSSDAVPLTEFDSSTPRETTVLAGPEGGWTAEEVHAASDVSRLVTLGPRTLRADAIALVAITALFVKWGEF